jgi:hypothetical protein
MQSGDGEIPAKIPIFSFSFFFSLALWLNSSGFSPSPSF